jgi:hypothetical protein
MDEDDQPVSVSDRIDTVDITCWLCCERLRWFHTARYSGLCGYCLNALEC